MIIDETRVAIADGADVICEAAFSYDGNYCAVDILRRKGDGWDIYEVKSSTYSTEEKDIGERLTKYAWDIAYQKWQVESFLNGKEYVDPVAIKDYLEQLILSALFSRF